MVNLIIRSTTNESLNISEKERYTKLLKTVSESLYKNYKRKSRPVQEKTDEYMVNLSKNLDGKTFTQFLKIFGELRSQVLEAPTHKITPDSFLIFLDKASVASLRP